MPLFGWRIWVGITQHLNVFEAYTPFTVASNTATAAGLSRCCRGVVFSVKARTRYKLSRDNTASR